MLHRKACAQAALALACAVILPLGVTSVASAAPVEGPSGEAFYTPPATLPEGGHGTLIWYRSTSVNLNVELPAVKAWDVMYKSTNQVGEADVVTGTVIVPTAAWTGSGSRPVITYAEGTQGLGHQCAPSLQIAAGTEYDGGAIVAALKKGYAVVVTDYQGYTTGATPAYIAGKTEGRAMLDIVQAAGELPGAGLSSSDPVVIWGYSQGGQAAGWAGQLLNGYAPNLHVIGVAAGGVPGNLQKLAEFGEGAVGSAFSFDSVIGLSSAYSALIDGEAALEGILTSEGLAAISRLKEECAIKSLEAFHDASFSNYDKGHETLAELTRNDLVLGSLVAQQQLGTMAIPVPVYHYHGLEDQFVPVKQDVELHEAWCSLGVKDDFQLYPGDHLLTDPTSIPYVMKWIEERVEGKAAPSTCGQHSAGSTLPSTARVTPETGDLLVPLPNWKLSGSVTDAKLGISLAIPEGASINATGDITSHTLSASLTIPPINDTVSVFGLPINIQANLTQAGPITGSVELSDAGVLSLNASGGANLTVKSIGISFLHLPIGCHTITPIQLPLSISAPVNTLSTGSLPLSAKVTIPRFVGCNAVYEFLVNAILEGPGNPLTLSATPPAPVNW